MSALFALLLVNKPALDLSNGSLLTTANKQAKQQKLISLFSIRTTRVTLNVREDLFNNLLLTNTSSDQYVTSKGFRKQKKSLRNIDH